MTSILRVFFVTSCPCIHEDLQMEKKKTNSKFKVMYHPLNSCKLINSKLEIRRNYAHFLKCTLKLICSIRHHKTPVPKAIIIHLFCLDIPSITVLRVHLGCFILQEASFFSLPKKFWPCRRNWFQKEQAASQSGEASSQQASQCSDTLYRRSLHR